MRCANQFGGVAFALRRAAGCLQRPLAVMLVTCLGLLAAPVTWAQIVLDFDTTAPRTDAELPDFFDVYGYDAEFGPEPFWHIDRNDTNPDNSTNALHVTSDGNQLANYFSRVAILKESVFFGENVELSAEITWDNLGGDATDNAGIYLRFNGDGDVGVENDFYHIRVGIDNGPPSSITIHKVKDGLADQLAREIDDPFPVATGETHTLRAKVETVQGDSHIWVWLDDEPVTGMDPFIDDIDPLLGPGRVGVGQETNPSYFDNITIIAPGAGAAQLQAGDADQDLDFDQLDLVRVQIAAKYLTGQAATWGQGDWDGAPGGSKGNPPAGNNRFDQLDIIAALANNLYLKGKYAAVAPGGRPGDGQTSIIYNATTGELGVDAPAGTNLTSVNIDSAARIFTGAPAQNLGGSFDNDSDTNIFKATFGSSFGSLSFGAVAQPGLAESFVLGDLTVVGSLAGGGALGNVDLIYIPEPTSLALASLGLLGLTAYGWRARRNTE
jgi:hypothetical protein